MSHSRARTDDNPARAHARGRSRPPAQLPSAAGGLPAPRWPPGPLFAAEPAPHLARTSAWPAGHGVPRGRGVEAQPRVREGAGCCALGSVYDEHRGLPWVGGCSGACGRCTSSSGRASPARSRHTFRSRVSGPPAGLGEAPGVPGAPRPFAALDRRPQESSALAETGKFPLGHPRSASLLATGMCEFFFQKRRKVKVARGAGRVWPALCGQERRCVLAAFEARPHPRKGKFEKLVI